MNSNTIVIKYDIEIFFYVNVSINDCHSLLKKNKKINVAVIDCGITNILKIF